jgi:hypothetical protein
VVVKDILFIQRLGFGILSFTGALVVLLGGWILVSAMTDTPDEMMEMASVVAPDSEADRSPNSVGMEPISLTGPSAAEIKVQTFSLGCLKDGRRAELVSTANQVRLKAKLCGLSQADLSKSSLVNRATGFEATLFNLRNGVFTSDYLALAEGANQIMMQISDISGERTVAEVTISRAQLRGGQSPKVKPAASSTRASEVHF